MPSCLLSHRASPYESEASMDVHKLLMSMIEKLRHNSLAPIQLAFISDVSTSDSNNCFDNSFPQVINEALFIALLYPRCMYKYFVYTYIDVQYLNVSAINVVLAIFGVLGR